VSQEKATTAKRTSVNKRAVIVGINKYRNMPEAELQGCVNDARDMVNTLKILGFPATHIHTLTDSQATKANIVKELQWLSKDAIPGDVRVYYHSSHGTQVKDLNNDEPDRVDESVITHDFDWDNPDTWLIDDDFYNYFTKNIPAGVRNDVILDTCYSGTGTKSIQTSTQFLTLNTGSEWTPVKTISKGRQSRFLPPPLGIQQRINSMRPQVTKIKYIGESVIQEGKSTKSERTQNNVLWSACQDYQVSWELDMGGGEIRGAFTYIFCLILRKANGDITRRDISNNAREYLQTNGFEQIPDLATPEAYPEAEDMAPFRKKSEKDTLVELQRLEKK